MVTDGRRLRTSRAKRFARSSRDLGAGSGSSGPPSCLSRDPPHALSSELKSLKLPSSGSVFSVEGDGDLPIRTSQGRGEWQASSELSGRGGQLRCSPPLWFTRTPRAGRAPPLESGNSLARPSFHGPGPARASASAFLPSAVRKSHWSEMRLCVYGAFLRLGCQRLSRWPARVPRGDDRCSFDPWS